jgi:hypothetical protein
LKVAPSDQLNWSALIAPDVDVVICKLLTKLVPLTTVKGRDDALADARKMVLDPLIEMLVDTDIVTAVPYDEPLFAEANICKDPAVEAVPVALKTITKLAYVVANPVTDCVVPLVVVSVARSVRLAAAGADETHAVPLLVSTLPFAPGDVRPVPPWAAVTAVPD